MFLYVFTNSPLQFAFKTKFYNPISCHIILFWNNCRTILKVLGSHANIFLFQWVKRGFLWLHLTVISGSEMRLAQMWCGRGFDKKTEIAIEPTWTLFGGETWVGVTRHSQAIHPDLLDLFRLKGLQCTIDEHHDWRALLSSWMMFGHQVACLVSASRKLFRRG